MPLYTYVCRGCGSSFELRRSFAERLEPVTCTECAADAIFTLSAPFIGRSMEPVSCSSPVGVSGGCCGGGACGRN